MRKMILLALSISMFIFMCGCGETIAGVGKDTNRMGKGVSTFFFRQ